MTETKSARLKNKKSTRSSKEKRIIGRTDVIDIPELGLWNVAVKIDTGANRSAMHCSKISTVVQDDVEVLTFHIPLVDKDEHFVHSTQDFYKKKIRSSSGHVEERFVVRTRVVIFGKSIKTSFSLTDRTEMNYPVLIGRKLLEGRFVVDVSQQDLSFKEKENNTNNKNDRR